jgi:hypothetical protein
VHGVTLKLSLRKFVLLIAEHQEWSSDEPEKEKAGGQHSRHLPGEVGHIERPVGEKLDDESDKGEGDSRSKVRPTPHPGIRAAKPRAIKQPRHLDRSIRLMLSESDNPRKKTLKKKTLHDARRPQHGLLAAMIGSVVGLVEVGPCARAHLDARASPLRIHV